MLMYIFLLLLVLLLSYVFVLTAVCCASAGEYSLPPPSSLSSTCVRYKYKPRSHAVIVFFSYFCGNSVLPFSVISLLCSLFCGRASLLVHVLRAVGFKTLPSAMHSDFSFRDTLRLLLPRYTQDSPSTIHHGSLLILQ